MKLKMKIQNRLARIAEGLYFINHRYEMDLKTILNLAPGAIKETQS
jgi:hypothetical protein